MTSSCVSICFFQGSPVFNGALLTGTTQTTLSAILNNWLPSKVYTLSGAADLVRCLRKLTGLGLVLLVLVDEKEPWALGTQRQEDTLDHGRDKGEA